MPSFRGDATHRTRNLEIPGLVLTHHPGMTVQVRPGPTSDVCDDAAFARVGSSAAGLAGAAVRLQAVSDRHLSHAGDRPAAGVPDLSAWPRRLAGVHRYHDRPPRRFRRSREFPVPAERSVVVERGILQRVLYRRRHLREIRAWLLAGAAVEQPLPVQEPV